MTNSKQSSAADSPAVKCFSSQSSEGECEKPVPAFDRIRMRDYEEISSPTSVKTTDSCRTIEYAPKGEDLESHASNCKLFDNSQCSSSASTEYHRSRSWLVNFHPSARTIEDAVMGTSDGMTVPFALTASLAGFAPNARYVMLAGLAELTAGAISMALGGALQARCEKETYSSTVRSTENTIRTTPDYLPATIDDLFSAWSFTPETLAHISRDLSCTPLSAQTAFIVRFHHELSIPDDSRVLKSSATLGISYFTAGFLGLFPYMIVQRTHIKEALYASIAIEAVALYVFGYAKTGVNVGWKGRENVTRAVVGAVIMVAVGAIASGIAVGLITMVNTSEHVAA